MSNIYPNCTKINKIMGPQNLLESLKTVPLRWKDSHSIQRLFDVLSSILAEEYIIVAKKNPEIFKEIASPPSGVRNDTENKTRNNTPAGGVCNDGGQE